MPTSQQNKKYIELLQKNNNVLSIDLTQIDKIRETINYKPFIEYMFFKLFYNPDGKFSEYLVENCTWVLPECWVVRYYLYYILHKNLLQDSKILDLGSNLNFYPVWAIENGAAHVDAIEAEPIRFNLSTEYVTLNKMESKIKTVNKSINEFMLSYDNQQYDVVFLLDVFYYLTNGIDVLEFIKNKIKPKYLFIEITVRYDSSDNGHFDIYSPSSDPKKLQSYVDRPGLIPSRNALDYAIKKVGWQVVSYYDYQSFIGRGESVPRSTGNKSFYVLKI